VLEKKGVFNLIILYIMSNILKYYTNIFTLMFKLDFAWGPEAWGAYEAIKEANSDFISSKEWERLKAKYQKKNPEDFKLALQKVYKEGLSADPKVINQIDNIVFNWNEGISETTEETQTNLSETRESLNNNDLQILENAFHNKRRLVLKKWVKWMKDEVEALQRILRKEWLYSKRIDWDFANGTFSAVKSLQRRIGTIDDWKFWKNSMRHLVAYLSKSSNSWIAEKTIRHHNSERVKWKIDAYSKSLDDVKALFSVSEELQKWIRNIRDNENDWYSIWHWIKALLGKNDRAALLSEQNKYANLLNANQDKLNRALDTFFSWDTAWGDMRVSSAKNFINKAWPWLIWVYITDIPLPFTAKKVPWLDLNQTLALEKWIKNWMPWEFKYTKADAELGKDVIAKAWDLRWTLTTYMWSRTAEKILSGRVEELSKKEKEVLVLYVKNILLPQMQYAHDDSFTVLKWDLFNLFDWLWGSQWDSQAVIDNLKKAVDSNDMDRVMELLWKELSLLHKEDEKSSKDIVSSLDNKVNIFNEMYNNNKLLSKIGRLLWLWENRLAILYKFEDLNWFIEAYWLQEFEETLSRVHSNIENNRDPYDGLGRKKKRIKQLFNVIWTDKLGEFKLRYLRPTKWTKYINRWLHKYWVDLRNAHTPDEKYNLLKNYWVEKARNWWVYNTIDTLYKWLINVQWLDNIWYSEFDNALKNLEEIPVSELNSVVLNTSRRWLSKTALTNFTRWLDKNDAYVNHTTIDKHFTYFQGGKKITEDIRYHIYLRPECSNLLIVPETIEWSKVVEDAPQLDTRMYDEIPLKVPLVIPYSVFSRWWKSWSKDSSTPWEERWGSNWGGGGTPAEVETWSGRT